MRFASNTTFASFSHPFSASATASTPSSAIVFPFKASSSRLTHAPSPTANPVAPAHEIVLLPSLRCCRRVHLPSTAPSALAPASPMSQYESTNCCSSHPTIVLAKACAPSGPASLECRLRSRMREQRASPSINATAPARSSTTPSTFRHSSAVQRPSAAASALAPSSQLSATVSATSCAHSPSAPAISRQPSPPMSLLLMSSVWIEFLHASMTATHPSVELLSPSHASRKSRCWSNLQPRIPSARSCNTPVVQSAMPERFRRVSCAPHAFNPAASPASPWSTSSSDRPSPAPPSRLSARLRAESVSHSESASSSLPASNTMPASAISTCVSALHSPRTAARCPAPSSPMALLLRVSRRTRPHCLSCAASSFAPSASMPMPLKSNSWTPSH
mmetsp:Transcript_58942/g.138967  ORF Transcript_58942/g.138967 Transcript_58942/m.138967 type:complete len:390 (-) Transcript_58942:880-2049(-)